MHVKSRRGFQRLILSAIHDLLQVVTTLRYICQLNGLHNVQTDAVGILNAEMPLPQPCDRSSSAIFSDFSRAAAYTASSTSGLKMTPSPEKTMTSFEN